MEATLVLFCSEAQLRSCLAFCGSIDRGPGLQLPGCQEAGHGASFLVLVVCM